MHMLDSDKQISIAGYLLDGPETPLKMRAALLLKH